MRDYEILYIVRPDLEEEKLNEAVGKVTALIETLGGQHERTNVWGKRRLAYEVDRLREGFYVLTEFQLDPGRVPEMESTLKISDSVFRHLIVRRPERKKVSDGQQAESVPAAPLAHTGVADTGEEGEALAAARPPEPAATEAEEEEEDVEP